MRWTRLAVLFSVGTQVACMPAYHYETRVLPTPPRSQPERCWQERRVEVADGDAQWHYSQGSPTFGLLGTGMVIEQHHFAANGMIFYRAGERLDPPDTLHLLGDSELEAAYRARLDDTAAASTMYPVWRATSLGMAFGGLGLALVALGQTLSKPSEERTSFPPTLWIGTGLALGAIIPAIFASTTYDGAVRHDRALHIMEERALEPRLEAALRAHNRRAAQACGASVDEELAVSPSVRQRGFPAAPPPKAAAPVQANVPAPPGSPPPTPASPPPSATTPAF